VAATVVAVVAVVEDQTMDRLGVMTIAGVATTIAAQEEETITAQVATITAVVAVGTLDHLTLALPIEDSDLGSPTTGSHSSRAPRSKRPLDLATSVRSRSTVRLQHPSCLT
jgi:hypothetical protein